MPKTHGDDTRGGSPACLRHLKVLLRNYGDRGSWRRALYRRRRGSRPAPVLAAVDSVRRVYWYRGRRLISVEAIDVTFPDSHGAGPMRAVTVPRRKVEVVT